MNIVIAGAGDLGFYLTDLLSTQNQSITLIDLDVKVLEYAETHLDILAIHGDTTSPEILKFAGVDSAHLFIAVTTNETANLFACILAKKLGAKKTIARVDKQEYLELSTRKYFEQIGIDHIVSPAVLAAQEIKRLIYRSSVTDVFDFDEGLISILGFTVDNSSSLVQLSFEELEERAPDFLIRSFCVLRNGKTIIPKKSDRILRSDHIYMVTNVQNFDHVNSYIGKTLRDIKKVMIIGGTNLALQTTKLLEAEFKVTLVVKDENRCKELLMELNDTLIINGDWGNIELLQEEGLNRMDAFLALSSNSESNIINCINAEQEGVYKTIALVDNLAYTQISLNIGVDTLINKRIIAANDIFRHVRKGKVEAIASLHGVNAEVIEFEIFKKNRIVRSSIKDLHLPEGARVIGIVRNNQGIIPPEDFEFKIGDKAIVFSLSQCIKMVENIFR